jgi:putative endonuclease
MRYVYILESLSDSSKHCTGQASDVFRRLKEHNDGVVKPTKAFCPWKVIVSVAFEDHAKAIQFEKYLKSGSGRAFAKRHF